MKKLITLFSLSLLLSFTAHAGSAAGKVTQLLIHTSGGNGQGVFMFLLDGHRANTPACSTVGCGKAWALSLEKESGRAMYALLLSAQAQGKTIHVHGRAHCNSWGDREEPHYITVPT